jgi:hypothetical protein
VLVLRSVAGSLALFETQTRAKGWSDLPTSPKLIPSHVAGVKSKQAKSTRNILVLEVPG